MKRLHPLSQILLLLSLSFSFSVFARRVLIHNSLSLDIMKKQITDTHDNYFQESGRNLEADYKKIAHHYSRIYPQQRFTELQKGVFIIDLDDTLLRMFTSKEYYTSREAKFPQGTITMVLKEALRKGMTILFLSSGMHTELEVLRDHICWEFNLTKKEFETRTDMIVGCKTWASYMDLARISEERGDPLGAKENHIRAVSKGDVWLSWVGYLIQQDQDLLTNFKKQKHLKVPVIMTDDWDINLGHVILSHHRSHWRFDMTQVKTFLMPSKEEVNLLVKRKACWMAIYDHLISFHRGKTKAQSLPRKESSAEQEARLRQEHEAKVRAKILREEEEMYHQLVARLRREHQAKEQARILPEEEMHQKLQAVKWPTQKKEAKIKRTHPPVILKSPPLKPKEAPLLPPPGLGYESLANRVSEYEKGVVYEAWKIPLTKPKTPRLMQRKSKRNCSCCF